MTSEPSPAPPNAPTRKPAPMVRQRTLIIVAVVMLLIGVAIGAASGPAGTRVAAVPSDTAAISQEPAIAAVATGSPSAAPSAGPTAEPTPEPTPEPTATAVAPVVVKGSGNQNTKPFDLAGGDLTVVITGSGRGNVIVHLTPRGGDVFSGESLFNEIANGKYRYETVVYGLEPGSYYLDAIAPGAWVVTLTPLV